MSAISDNITQLVIFESMDSELKNIGGDFRSDINKIDEKYLEISMKEKANRIGQLLHNLHKDKPEKETLKKLIHEFPSSLECKNDKGQLPIQSAVWNDGVSVGYVPLLAEEGIKYNIGGDNARGGLLVEDPTDTKNRNVLQLLVNMRYARNPILYDTAYLNIMKDLRDMNLLVKNDIQDHDLFFHACSFTSKLRFEYLADWSPDGLKTYIHRGLPILNSIIKRRPIAARAFPTFLKALLKHHPQEAGLLFQKDRKGKTACDYAFDKYGKEETQNILRDLMNSESRKRKRQRDEDAIKIEHNV